MSSRRGLAAGLGLGLGLLLAEPVVRLTEVELPLMEPLVPLQVTDVGIHRPSEDPTLLYALRPDLDLELPPSSPQRQNPRRVRTNRLGFRDPERAEQKPAGVWRVLCLGGSNTFGATVNDEETWPAQLERTLRAQGVQAEVWNLGVSGYMTRQSAALAEQAIPRWDPDLVLVQVYNVGRRFLLLGDDLGRVLRLDPRLYAEWLWLAPAPDSAGWGAWRSSAALRVGVIAANRVLSAGPFDPVGPLTAASDAADTEALQRLARAHMRLPILAMLPPSGGPEVPIEALDLHARYGEEAEPFGPEGRDIHPEPEVYGWYAERIAQMLGQRGLLPP